MFLWVEKLSRLEGTFLPPACKGGWCSRFSYPFHVLVLKLEIESGIRQSWCDRAQRSSWGHWAFRCWVPIPVDWPADVTVTYLSVVSTQNEPESSRTHMIGVFWCFACRSWWSNSLCGCLVCMSGLRTNKMFAGQEWLMCLTTLYCFYWSRTTTYRLVTHQVTET